MMFEKTQLGWRLICQSLAVFKDRKKWLLFSLAGRGTFFLILLAGLLLAGIIRAGYIDYHQLSRAQILWGYAIFIIALFVGNLISAYFNAVLTSALCDDYPHPNPPPGRGRESSHLLAAAKRLPVIFIWLLTHFTYGITTVFFKKKIPPGLNWHMASFFIPALLINEPAGIKTTLQCSAHLMFNFAGSDPKIRFSFFWLSLALRILALIPALLGYLTNETVWIIAGIAFTSTLLLTLSILQNAIQVVFLQALYSYAAHKKTTLNFQTTDLAAIF